MAEIEMKLFCNCNANFEKHQSLTVDRQVVGTGTQEGESFGKCPLCKFYYWVDADYENQLFDERKNVQKIEGLPLTKDNIYDPVTYVPRHAEGNAGHKDCELGVIIGWNSKGVRVLYCKSRNIQLTPPEFLVFG